MAWQSKPAIHSPITPSAESSYSSEFRRTLNLQTAQTNQIRPPSPRPGAPPPPRPGPAPPNLASHTGVQRAAKVSVDGAGGRVDEDSRAEETAPLSVEFSNDGDQHHEQHHSRDLTEVAPDVTITTSPEQHHSRHLTEGSTRCHHHHITRSPPQPPPDGGSTICHHHHITRTAPQPPPDGGSTRCHHHHITTTDSTTAAT